MAIENFGVGTLIIPMDATYQNLGMYRAYGLVYELLDNGIPVKWAIQSGKSFNSTDFIASATDFQTAAPIVNHNYSGGPFIIDSAFAAVAAPIITAWQVANPNVKVHQATAPFSADIAATMNVPTRIAVEEKNASIAYNYLNAAGIPDSNGNNWSNASPGVLSEAEIGAGALFGFDLTACRRNAYDILISPHTGSGQWDAPNLIIELNDWLYRGGFLHSMCESIPSIENEAGPFLTQTGLDDSDKNGGDTGTFTVTQPDFPTTQAVNTTNPQPTPGGSVETWLNANQNYNPQTQVLAYFTDNSDQYDFMIAGPYKNGNGAGKVVYEGGHQYTNSLPYTNGPENMYTRFVLNDVFFAVGKPLMYLELSTPNPNNVLYQGQNNTITFSVVNTGASPSTNTGFSVTLAPGVTYNGGSATIPPTSIVGQTLSWTPAALGNVPPGTVLTFTANYTPMGPLGDTQLATFSTTFGDEFNENYSMNNICVEGEVVAFESADLDVTKDVDLDFATYGDILTYTVTITNNGVLTANNVIFRDIIPDNATFVPNSVTVAVPPGLPVPVPGADPNVGFALPDIPPFPAPGSTVVVTFQVTVDIMEEPDNVVNQAEVDYQFTVDGTTFDSTSESNVVVTSVNIGKLTLLKITDTTVATIGDIITYTVGVFNTGNVDAENVVFFDNPPAGTSFIPGSVFVDGVNQPGANPIAGIPLGTIIPGTLDSPDFVPVSFQVEVTSIPDPPEAINTASADFEWRVDPQGPTTPGTDESNEVITQLVTPELTVVKSADVAFANIGDTITYTVTVTNTGDVTAEDVVLTDPVPAGTTFVPGSVTVGGFPAPGADPNVGIPLGDIPPGGSVTVTFQVTATSVPVPNPTTNIATATGLFTIEPTEPPRPLDLDSNPVDVQIEDAFITATKSVDLAFAEVGDTLTYTVVIDNPGTTDANNVVFTDNPPNGTTFVPGSITVNGAPVPGDPSLGIPVGTITAGSFATVTFEVTVDAIPVPNPAVNIGTVDADLPIDPNNPTHVTVDTNPVPTQVSIAQVDVIKTVDQAFAEVGDILTYTVTVNNTGTIPANNAVLTDILPNGTTFVPGTVTINGGPSGDNPNVGIPLGNIAAGGSVTVTFQAEATSIPVPNPAVNIGTLTALYPIDPNNPVQRDTDSNEVETQIEIAQVDVVKTVDKAFVEVGDTLTYTTTITNTGSVTATNVIFTDAPPNGTSFIPGTLTVDGFPTAGNPAAGIPLADIPVGGNRVVSFQVTVDTLPVPNPVENISVVDALYPVDPDNPTPKTFESNPVETQVEIVDINVVKSADKEFVEVGDTLTYTVVVTNTGTVTVDNVIFNDTPPIGTTFIPGTFRLNGVIQPGADPSVGVNIGSIPPGGFKTVSFRVTVDVLPPGGQITNTASVDFDFRIDPAGPVETRTEPSNPVTTEVELVQLQVLKDVDKTVAVIGETLTYTANIANLGTVTAMDVVFTDEIPAGTSLVENSVLVNGVVQLGANPEAGIPIGDIPPGGFATVVFSVLVEERPEPPEVVNMAIIDFNVQIDPNGPIDERTEESPPIVTRIEIVELVAVKTADKADVNVGDTLTYTVAITNTGTLPVENVVFKDQVPTGTKLVANSLRVNGVVQPGANPSIGVPIGTIQPGATVIVTFSVIIESQPCPPELINMAVITYDYRLESTGSAIRGITVSNEVITDVGLRIFKQFSVDENLTIPPQKPDAEDILEVLTSVEITSQTVIKTPVVTSYEGQRLTGWKVIVEGKLKQKIVYIADEPSQSVHAAEFDVPFSTFLVLPADYRPCQNIRIVGYIEDVYSQLIDSRTIFKNVTLRVEGILSCI